MIKLVDIYDGTRIREGALEFLYKLMEEREPEINISHRAMPTFEQHRQFWTRRPYRCCYLIEGWHKLGGLGWAGYISATQRNEIGIVLLKDWRGQGIGPLAVQELMRLHKPMPAIPSEVHGNWLANIAPANERSKSMFTRLGFREIQRTYELTEEENHGNEKTDARSA